METGSISVITFSNRSERYFPQFLKSCERFGVKPVVLNPGPSYHPFTRGGRKWNMLHQHLLQAPADSFALVVDSHDLIFVEPLEAIFEKWRTFNSSLVVSAESDCWPDKNLIHRHTKTPDPYRFVNSGGVMGTRDAIMGALVTMRAPDRAEKGNDQDMLMRYVVENPQQVRLDTRGEIWTNLHFAEEAIEFRDERIYNRLSGVFPGIIHANGKVSLDHVLGWLGWK